MADSSFESGKDVLRGTVTLDIMPRREIVECTTDTPVAEVYSLLAANRILSMPVYNAKLRRYVALVDLLDIVAYLSTHNGDFTETLQNVTAGELAGSSERNPYRAVEGSANLHNSLRLMLNGKLHRIAVLDSENDLDGLLTQSHVVKYLAKYIHLFASHSKTIGELQLGIREVKATAADVPIRAALCEIKENKVSALAVTDSDGKLANVLSVSDIRMFIGPDGFNASLLDAPVAEFLSRRSERADKVIPGLICVNEGTTVEELVIKLVETGVHRVFVVDLTTQKPIGVIALYDVLNLLASEA